MTENKPIIIDGVDVSGCEAYKDEHCKDKTSIMFCNTNLCSNFPNCYYKQLKRKEQECERLRFPMKDSNYAILTKEEFEDDKKLKETLTEMSEHYKITRKKKY